MSSRCRDVAGAVALAALTACGLVAHRPPARELRVCADPNNLPFSNRRGDGFENRLAALIARDMNARVAYTWWAQRRGFIRNTLKAGLCDVVMGVPSGFELALPTRPYYRSTYVMVSRRDAGLALGSLDDPTLRRLRVGVQLIGDDYANTPPAHALAKRGIVDNVVGFPVYGDYAHESPPAGIVEAVARGDVDVAIVWGPLAGYFASRESSPLTLTPLDSPVDQRTGTVFEFAISVGVRRGDTRLRDAIQRVLDRRADAVNAILARYGVVGSGSGALVARETQ